MCGPSGSEKAIAGQQQSFASTLQQDFGTRFANQNEVLGNLNGIIQNVSEGRLAPGFDANTKAALTTQAINTTGANYANAARAVGNQLAGRGGDAGLESGVDQQIKAGVASASAGQLSKEENDIQLADRQAAERNTATAIGGFSTLAGLDNPSSYSRDTIGEQGEAYSSAKSNAEASSQEFADIAGGISGIVQKGAGIASAGISAANPNADTSILDAIA